MDSTQELIDTVMTQHHQLPQSKLAASQYAPLRLRILKNAKRAAIWLNMQRDWTFRYVDGATVTVLANTSDIALPAAWANEGQQGGVWLSAEEARVTWRRSGEVTDLLNSSAITGTPEVYTVIGNHTLRVWPKPAANTTFKLYYLSSGPVLTDANPGGITYFPNDWRETVLYERVIWQEMKDKGDVSSLSGQMDIVKEALFAMICDERQGKPEASDFPRYAGAADVSWIE